MHVFPTLYSLIVQCYLKSVIPVKMEKEIATVAATENNITGYTVSVSHNQIKTDQSGVNKTLYVDN